MLKIDLDLDSVFADGEWGETIGSMIRDEIKSVIRTEIKKAIKGDTKLKKVITELHKRAATEMLEKLGVDE